MQILSLTSWHYDDAKRRFWTSRFDIGMTLRRRFRASRLDITSMIFISLASEVWTLLFDDLSLVIFRQSIKLPPKFSKLCSWLGRISRHFRLSIWKQALKTGWQSSEIFWAQSYLDLDLRECTVKLFEATRDDHHECLDTHFRPPRCFELVFGVLLNRGNSHLLSPVYCWTDCRSKDWTHVL